MADAFFEEGSRLLTPHAFEFVLDGEMKRAVRSQNYLTLVVLETRREWDGMTVTADDGTVDEVAQIVGHEVRDTDLLGNTETGVLSLVLLDADYDNCTQGHRSARPADRPLRLHDAAAHLRRRGLLSDARRRRRLAEAPGAVPSRRELARRRARITHPPLTSTAHGRRSPGRAIDQWKSALPLRSPLRSTRRRLARTNAAPN